MRGDPHGDGVRLERLARQRQRLAERVLARAPLPQVQVVVRRLLGRRLRDRSHVTSAILQIFSA